MDPYLEAHWRDVHAALIIYARDALQGVLPSPLHCYPSISSRAETILCGEFGEVEFVESKEGGQDASSLDADLVTMCFLHFGD